VAEARLALEDGTVFLGEAFGAPGETVGEVIFNTSMTGYQEILTDPSYKGQIVAMTYPLIGNTGVNREDAESARPQAEAFVVRDLSPIPSNWRQEEGLPEWLARHRGVGIQGVDTRRLTGLLREKGFLKGVVSSAELDPKRLVEKARAWEGLSGRDWVAQVTCAAPHPGPAPKQKRFKVAAIDCGMKANIGRLLADSGCETTIYPASTAAATILKEKPDGLFVSNGPGDPEAVPYVIETVRNCLGKLPIFGICLGHQIVGLALGGRTFKLKFGHHGGNHPVLDLKTNQVEITAQNHGFAVDPDSLPADAVEVTHLNLNDRTCEGLRHKKWPLFSVQYHPEAAPGPHDAGHLFDRFVRMMETGEAP